MDALLNTVIICCFALLIWIWGHFLWDDLIEFISWPNLDDLIWVILDGVAIFGSGYVIYIYWG